MSKAPAAPDAYAVAMVNGHPVHADDVAEYVRSSSHEEKDSLERRKNALEVIIDEELATQKAEALGLQPTEVAQTKIRGLQSQIEDIRRHELSAAYFRQQVRAQSGGDDIAAFYKANEANIRTDVHVFQILRRSEAEINEVEAQLKKGVPFEELAAQPFAKLPPAVGNPWDLGFLKWSQVPEPWQGLVYDMAPGAVSGVIKGPNERFWIIQVVAKQENPGATLEAMRPVLEKLLGARREEAARTDAQKKLRSEAKVEYLNPALLSPAAPVKNPDAEEE